MSEVHPLIIIGSGPAAWTAAIYAAPVVRLLRLGSQVHAAEERDYGAG